MKPSQVRALGAAREKELKATTDSLPATTIRPKTLIPGSTATTQN